MVESAFLLFLLFSTSVLPQCTELTTYGSSSAAWSLTTVATCPDNCPAHYIAVHSHCGGCGTSVSEGWRMGFVAVGKKAFIRFNTAEAMNKGPPDPNALGLLFLDNYLIAVFNLTELTCGHGNVLHSIAFTPLTPWPGFRWYIQSSSPWDWLIGKASCMLDEQFLNSTVLVCVQPAPIPDWICPAGWRATSPLLPFLTSSGPGKEQGIGQPTECAPLCPLLDGQNKDSNACYITPPTNSTALTGSCLRRSCAFASAGSDMTADWTFTQAQVHHWAVLSFTHQFSYNPSQATNVTGHLLMNGDVVGMYPLEDCSAQQKRERVLFQIPPQLTLSFTWHVVTPPDTLYYWFLGPCLCDDPPTDGEFVVLCEPVPGPAVPTESTEPTASITFSRLQPQTLTQPQTQLQPPAVTTLTQPGSLAPWYLSLNPTASSSEMTSEVGSVVYIPLGWVFLPLILLLLVVTLIILRRRVDRVCHRFLARQRSGKDEEATPYLKMENVNAP